MKKNQNVIKLTLAMSFALAFVFLMFGIKSEAEVLSGAETTATLEKNIADVKVQITEKQVEILKQQIENVQKQIIQLLQQRIAAVQAQITEKQSQIVSLTPNQKIVILKQQIADIQVQIADKQKQLASLIPSTPAVITPSAPISILPSMSEGEVGSKDVEENIGDNIAPGLNTKGALAATSDFFSANNFSQLFFFIVIVIIALAALALFRSKNKEKSWLPYLVISIAPFIYRGFYSNNWLILLALSIGILIIDWILQERKQKQVQLGI